MFGAIFIHLDEKVFSPTTPDLSFFLLGLRVWIYKAFNLLSAFSTPSTFLKVNKAYFLGLHIPDSKCTIMLYIHLIKDQIVDRRAWPLNGIVLSYLLT